MEHSTPPRIDKIAERRIALGEAALKTLSELGYARTSLREIAQNSEFSHGVLHYYFKDKQELILCCVRQYKAHCVKRYDPVVTEADSVEALMDGFLASLGETLRNDALMHRLWYDLRSQALFEEAFRADVAEIDLSLEKMIWKVMERFSLLAAIPLTITSAAIYAMMDGLFQQCLLRHLSGDADAVAVMQQNVRWLVAHTLGLPGLAAAPGTH